MRLLQSDFSIGLISSELQSQLEKVEKLLSCSEGNCDVCTIFDALPERRKPLFLSPAWVADEPGDSHMSKGLGAQRPQAGRCQTIHLQFALHSLKFRQTALLCCLKNVMATACRHPKVRIVSRHEDTEYVECLECGEVFDSEEYHDMQIEEEEAAAEAEEL